MVTIKSEREIELMREAGKILAKVHEELGKVVRPGISTKEIDRICEEMIRSYGCIPSFLGYEGYPASVCNSTVTVYLDNVWYRNQTDREKYNHPDQEEPDLLHSSR